MKPVYWSAGFITLGVLVCLINIAHAIVKRESRPLGSAAVWAVCTAFHMGLLVWRLQS